MFPDAIAEARQQDLIKISDVSTAKALRLWRQVDFDFLDPSWARIEAAIVGQATAAQMKAATSADTFTSKMTVSYGEPRVSSAIVPQAFVGVDGSGRDVGSLLYGAVTSTKEAVGSGLGRQLSMQAGATYLAAMFKTLLADQARSADMVSSIGRGYTRYVRVVEPGACSRCIILAGATQFKPFQRHPACRCTCQPLPVGQSFGKSPSEIFDEMSEAEQDRVFTKAGAQAIRDGGDVQRIVSARRSVPMRPASSLPSSSGWARMQKTTIGYRPDGQPVQVYSTLEGATRRGEFGKAQSRSSAWRRLQGARYDTTSRVRLMPESIIEIAGDDEALRLAFLRDAGYIQYRPRMGYTSNTAEWMADIEEQRLADRLLVNRATLRYGNFTLG